MDHPLRSPHSDPSPTASAGTGAAVIEAGTPTVHRSDGAGPVPAAAHGPIDLRPLPPATASLTPAALRTVVPGASPGWPTAPPPAPVPGGDATVVDDSDSDSGSDSDSDLDAGAVAVAAAPPTSAVAATSEAGPAAVDEAVVVADPVAAATAPTSAATVTEDQPETARALRRSSAARAAARSRHLPDAHRYATRTLGRPDDPATADLVDRALTRALRSYRGFRRLRRRPATLRSRIHDAVRVEAWHAQRRPRRP